ncbi:MAG: hypothetical protein K2W95_05115 [Candidatus Obscuribacterales bacterium]|nr:hypothetical protein [Candidatus Obscuribacterales bacterium]
MCRFITAVVPAGFDLLASKVLLERHEMSFTEISNPFVQSQLGGDQYLRATRCMCDCDSALGSAAQPQGAAQKAVPDLAEIARLRKKGWSQHKIDRWLAEKSGSLERHKKHSEREAELTLWRNFIGDLLSEGAAKRLGLLLHTYSGTLQSEQVQIKRFEKLALSDLSENALLAMEEDVVYTVSEN